MPQPKQPKQPDRQSALQQIPTQLHGLADHMAAQGVPWGSILSFILSQLPGLIQALSKGGGATATP